MAPDAWEKLLYETLKTILAVCTPILSLWLLSRLFKNVTADFTTFIRQAMKSEFKTTIGKINLLGMFIMFLLLVIPSNSVETSVSTKAFIFGLFFTISLLISYFQSRKRRVTGNKDDSANFKGTPPALNEKSG